MPALTLTALLGLLTALLLLRALAPARTPARVPHARRRTQPR
ncbi:hypothetical protein ACWDSJ_10025 [Nocardia sp. NPDC003482]